VKVVHLPLRITVGASILNTDRSKQGLKGEAAAGVHVRRSAQSRPCGRSQRGGSPRGGE